MEKLSFFLRRALWGLFLLLIMGGALLGTVGNLDHLSYIAAFIFACAMVLCLLFGKRDKDRNGMVLAGETAECQNHRTGEKNKASDRQRAGKEAAILALLCLVTNGGFVLMFHPIQAPDYQTFLEAAENLAAGILPRNHAYLAMFPHILGYAAFLSLFLRLFGGGILTASLVNAGLSALSCIAVYKLGKIAGGRKAGRIAALLWIFCPSKMLFNTMSLSEPYYTCLLLFFFLLLIYLDRRYSDPDYSAGINESYRRSGKLCALVCSGLCGGVLLALINTARPIGIIPIIALAIWILFLRRGYSGVSHWLILILVMISVYTAIGALWRDYENRILGEEPAGIPGYSVCVGFNMETGGSYADEDMELLQSRYFGEDNGSAPQAQQYMLDLAKARISENGKALPRLMLTKLGTLLGHDEAGAFYAKESLTPRVYSLLCIFCNVWYYCLCLLAIPACVHYSRRVESGAILLLPLFAVGLILAQLLVEVAARYHYALIPILTLLAALSLSLPDRFNTRMREGKS